MLKTSGTEPEGARGRGVLGEYRYVSTIGQGSFARVILLEDLTDFSKYACKIISKKLLIEKNLVSSFQREVVLFSSLKHPNIVNMVKMLSDDESIYIIMEYCSGGDLQSFINKEGVLSESRVRFLFAQIAKALHFLHENMIAHRDLKPENILLTEDETVKIADFGFSRELEMNTLMSTQCGSPIFTAPEIISGTQYNGLMSDMWSLGVILYILATGKVPWDMTSQVFLLQQIQSARFHIPENLSPLLRSLIHSLMLPIPKMRLNTRQVLDHPWFSGPQKYIPKQRSALLQGGKSVTGFQVLVNNTSIHRAPLKSPILNSVRNVPTSIRRFSVDSGRPAPFQAL